MEPGGVRLVSDKCPALENAGCQTDTPSDFQRSRRLVEENPPSVIAPGSWRGGSLDLVSGVLSRVLVTSPEMLRSGNLLGLLFPNSTLRSSLRLLLFRDPFLASFRFYF